MIAARPGIEFGLAARPGSTYSTAVATKSTKRMSLMDESQLRDANATLSSVFDQHVPKGDVL